MTIGYSGRKYKNMVEIKMENISSIMGWTSYPSCAKHAKC